MAKQKNHYLHGLLTLDYVLHMKRIESCCIINNQSNFFRCNSSITEKACHLDVFLLCIRVFLTMCKIKLRMVVAFSKKRGLRHCGKSCVFSIILGFFPPMCFNVCKTLANDIMNLKQLGGKEFLHLHLKNGRDFTPLKILSVRSLPLLRSRCKIHLFLLLEGKSRT